jgi:hypothetical protein
MLERLGQKKSEAEIPRVEKRKASHTRRPMKTNGLEASGAQ